MRIDTLTQERCNGHLFALPPRLEHDAVFMLVLAVRDQSDPVPYCLSIDRFFWNGQAERKALEAKAAEVPKDHPMSIAVEMAVKEIRRNPFWTPEQRELFIGRLVHQAIRPESPESESESERERDDEASE